MADGEDGHRLGGERAQRMVGAGERGEAGFEQAWVAGVEKSALAHLDGVATDDASV